MLSMASVGLMGKWRGPAQISNLYVTLLDDLVSGVINYWDSREFLKFRLVVKVLESLFHFGPTASYTRRMPLCLRFS